MQEINYSKLFTVITGNYRKLIIYSTPNQRRIWNPVEHLRWSLFAEIVNVLRLMAIFAEELHRITLTGF